jgi:hypothetical protein
MKYICAKFKTMSRYFILLSFLLTLSAAYSQCACCAGAGIGSSNGDYNSGVLTLKKKQLIAEAYADYRTIREGGAIEEDEKLLENMFIASLGVKYGFTDQFTVSALLPYVNLQTNSGNDNGLGDLVLVGTYKLYNKKDWSFAAQAGVELPTGIQKDSNFDNTTVVVGSGSFDPIAGVLFSKNWDRTTLQGNALYKFTTKGFQDNYYGSLAVHNLSLAYRLKKGSAFCAVDSLENKSVSDFGVNVYAGYYGEWLDKIKEDGIVDEDSGYYMGFANIGLNMAYQRWSFPLTLSLPVVEEMNGNQNPAGYRIRLGIICLID